MFEAVKVLGEVMSKDEIVVNDQVVADTTATDSTPEETNTSEVADDAGLEAFDKGFTEDDTTPEEETDSSSDEPQVDESTTEETKADDKPQGEQEQLAPKSVNRFQQLANENRELKEQLDRLKLQESQLATEQELLNEINPETGDYYTPQEVERIAWQQSREQQQQQVAEQRYALQVQQNLGNMEAEATKALQDFPMFDRASPEYDAELAAQAADVFRQGLITDKNGQIVGSNISPYQLYKTIADSAQRAAAKAMTIGQAQAQKATSKMLANADALGGVTQKTPPKDDFLKGFESADY